MEVYSVIDRFPSELRGAVSYLVDFIREEMGVSREDFSELKAIVKELAEAQKRTEERVSELTEAQKRTEERVNELTEAQKRTEERVNELIEAQKRSENDINELKAIVKELTEAQKRTEERVNELTEAQKRSENDINELKAIVKELAEAQKHTEEAIADFSKEFHMRITALGSRWGFDAEASFRNGMREILWDIGYEVERFEVKDKKGVVFGHPEMIELDVIIKDGKVILAEIKSAATKNDIYVFLKKCKFYEEYTGRKASKLVFITPAPDARAYDLTKEFGIKLCSFTKDLDKLFR